MRDYELTVVLPGATTEAKKKAFIQKLEKIVNVLEGKLGKLNDWGKLNLEYSIKKEDSGVFLHYNLELNPAGARDLEDKLRHDDQAIRHLLVKNE